MKGGNMVVRCCVCGRDFVGLKPEDEDELSFCRECPTLLLVDFERQMNNLPASSLNELRILRQVSVFRLIGKVPETKSLKLESKD